MERQKKRVWNANGDDDIIGSFNLDCLVLQLKISQY